MANAVIQAAVQTVLDKASLNKVEGEIDGASGRIGGRLKGIGGIAKNVALGVAGIGLAGVGAAAALVSNFVESSRELQAFSQRVGVSTTDLQQWGAVAAMSGGNTEDITDALREMNLRLAEASELGSGPAIDALNILGVGMEELGDKTPSEQFALLRDRISEVEDPAKRAFLAEELLGGSSERLAGFLALSSDELDRQTESLGAGAVKSEASINAAVTLGNTIDKLKQFITGLINEGLALLIPELVKLGTLINETVVPAFNEHLRPIIQDFIKDYLPTLKKVFGTVFKVIYEVVKLAVGLVVNDLKFLFTTIKGIVNLVSALIRGDWSAAWQALKDIVNGALTFLRTKVELVLKFVKGIFNSFGIDIGNVFIRMGNAGARFVNRIVDFFTNSIPTKIKRGINAIIRSFQFIPDSFVGALNSVIRAWNNFSIRTPAVKLLGKTVIPAVTFNTPNVATFRARRLPQLQEGGIAIGDTLARIGEGGEPEAVVPLSRASEFGFGGGAQTIINITQVFEGDTQADETALRTAHELQRALRLGNTQITLTGVS